MTIPPHIIDSGARALFERDCKDYRNGGGIATPDPWEQQSPADQHAYRKRASAVIRATSKRIWDSGYEAGMSATEDPWIGIAAIRKSDIVHIRHRGRNVEVTFSPKGSNIRVHVDGEEWKP